MSVEIRRGSDRFTERTTGRLSHHGFSFGSSYDPERLSFGPMVCHDDHVLGRDTGFEDHPHESLEIVTWVVSGTLVHTHGDGEPVTLDAGACGVLSSGDGVRHAEIAGPDGPARFVQVWLTPDDPTGDAAHAVAPVAAAPGVGLVPVVGGDGPLSVRRTGASMAVARLGAGETLALPHAARVHLFVATGALLRFSLAEPLAAGDACLLTTESVDGGEDHPTTYEVTAAVPTELLVWTFDS